MSKNRVLSNSLFFNRKSDSSLFNNITLFYYIQYEKNKKKLIDITKDIINKLYKKRYILILECITIII